MGWLLPILASSYDTHVDSFHTTSMWTCIEFKSLSNHKLFLLWDIILPPTNSCSFTSLVITPPCQFQVQIYRNHACSVFLSRHLSLSSMANTGLLVTMIGPRYVPVRSTAHFHSCRLDTSLTPW